MTFAAIALTIAYEGHGASPEKHAGNAVLGNDIFPVDLKPVAAAIEVHLKLYFPGFEDHRPPGLRGKASNDAEV
jgi:hypothetical protein